MKKFDFCVHTHGRQFMPNERIKYLFLIRCYNYDKPDLSIRHNLYSTRIVIMLRIFYIGFTFRLGTWKSWFSFQWDEFYYWRKRLFNGYTDDGLPF